MISIAERLKELRCQKTLTQKELAIMTEVGERTIQRFENSESEPTLSNIIKLADALEVSIDYLVGRTDVQSVIKK